MSTIPDEQERIDPFKLFSEEIREPVKGLTYLGYLTDTVDFCGHRFGLQTLYPEEKAAISTVIQPWRGTLNEPEIWNNAHVAVALTSIDGDENFCPPIGPNLESFVTARLRYATSRETGLFQPTLDYLYEFYARLEVVALTAIRELQDLSLGRRQSSMPSAASSTGRGVSADEIDGETPDSTTSS